MFYAQQSARGVRVREARAAAEAVQTQRSAMQRAADGVRVRAYV